MGTSGLTVVLNKDDEPITCIYFQSDGYPEGYGVETAKLIDKIIVDGIPLNTNQSHLIANGMDCLAAQLIRDLKKDVGGIYIISPNNFSIDYGYIYFVCFDNYDKKPYIKFFQTNWDSDKSYTTISSVLEDSTTYSIDDFIRKFNN